MTHRDITYPIDKVVNTQTYIMIGPLFHSSRSRYQSRNSIRFTSAFLFLRINLPSAFAV